MKDLTKKTLRISITLTLVIAAIALGHLLWVRYMDSPWTRDGRVRADVVNIAPDVAGLVTEVAVRDNQFVHKGDLLFRIDADHYRHALAQAQALVEQRRAMLDMKRGQATRRAALDDKIRAALEKFSLKDAASVVAAETGQPRRKVYARALELSGGTRPE